MLNVVPADREVSEHLVSHPRVDKISFTGSTRAGSRIGAICGEQIKRCTLELGGKSAAIILDDADLDAVIPALAPATMPTTARPASPRPGSSRRAAATTRSSRRWPATIGAFAGRRPRRPDDRRSARWSARRSATGSRATSPRDGDEGARLVVGGGRPPELERGWYVEPTVFADVDNGMTIAQEEIFGPVVAVIPYDDEDDAVAHRQRLRLRPLRLGVDRRRRARAARRRSGSAPAPSASTSSMLDFGGPFGGFKQSGLGREFGPEGIDEYVELQQLTAPLASARRLVAAPHVLEQRACGPVQRRHDLVAVEAVVIVKREPCTPGTEATEHRLGAPRLVGRQVARHLGHRRRHRDATLLLQLVARQRPEDVRVLVEDTAHLRDRAGQVVHRPRVVPARAAGELREPGRGALEQVDPRREVAVHGPQRDPGRLGDLRDR